MITRRLFARGLLAVFATLAATLAGCLVAPAAEKTLYKKQSAYSTIVVTEDEQGLRTLWFEENGARQSVVKPGDPDHVDLAYAKVMPVGLAFAERPRLQMLPRTTPSGVIALRTAWRNSRVARW